MKTCDRVDDPAADHEGEVNEPHAVNPVYHVGERWGAGVLRDWGHRRQNQTLKRDDHQAERCESNHDDAECARDCAGNVVSAKGHGMVDAYFGS